MTKKWDGENRGNRGKETSCGYVITEAITLDIEEATATFPGLNLSTLVLPEKLQTNYDKETSDKNKTFCLPALAMYCLIFSYAGNWIATWLTPTKEGTTPLISAQSK